MKKLVAALLMILVFISHSASAIDENFESQGEPLHGFSLDGEPEPLHISAVNSHQDEQAPTNHSAATAAASLSLLQQASYPAPYCTVRHYKAQDVFGLWCVVANAVPLACFKQTEGGYRAASERLEAMRRSGECR